MFRSCILLLALFLFPVSSVHAARSMTITSDTLTLHGDEEMTVTASFSGFTDGETVYVKGAFYKDGTTNYFGLTHDSGAWIKNSAPNADQRQVVIGQWDGRVVVRSDFSDSGYQGEGEYRMRLRYYYGSFTGDWSENALTVTVNAPDPTVTPLPTATPTLRPYVPSVTPTPTPTMTIVPTATPTPTFFILHAGDLSSDILAEETDDPVPATRGATITDQNDSVSEYRSGTRAVFATLVAGVGLSLLSFGLSLKQTDIWKR